MELWIKAIHIISIVVWMAGLFYLPRLFVYHAASKPGSEQSETFKVMERRLLRVIMNPAMIVVWVTGPYLAWAWSMYRDGWLMAKFVLVLGLTVLHHALAKWRKDFATDQNRHSERFYRYVNEVPTVLLIGIVVLVVVKPF